MTTEQVVGNVGFAVHDTVEVIEGFDHHRGWILKGTKIQLAMQKATGEWIGEEVGKCLTITIPANTKKYVKKI